MELQRIIEEGSDTDFDKICLHPTVIIQTDRWLFGWIYHFNCHITPLRVKLYPGAEKKR